MQIKEKPLSYKVSGQSGTAAVIVAAGSSSRMDGLDKQFLSLNGIPVIVRSILAFEKSSVEKIIVVTKKECIGKIKIFINEYGIKKVSDIVIGKETRQESVLEGVKKVDLKNVIIHDGARPLVSQQIIKDVIDALNFSSAVAPVIDVTDTLKRVNNLGFIESTINRENTFAVQTPQGFNTKEYLAAALNAPNNITDDCAVMELANKTIKTVNGSKNNIKITFKEDLLLAEYLLKIM